MITQVHPREIHAAEHRSGKYGRGKHLSVCLTAALVTLLFGCSLTVMPQTGKDGAGRGSDARSKRATAEEVWRVLADAIDSETIDSSSRLAQYVVVLTKNGELSAADVMVFDSAFPGIAKSDRPLSDADAQLLRTLK